MLAETFANYTNETALTALSTNWSTNVTGTSGYYWAKIASTVNTVAYPATDQAVLYTCNKYSATNDGGATTRAIYSTDGTTYYTSRDLQTIFNATGYEISADGTDYQIPSYVYGKCISVQHRNSAPYYVDYTLTSAVSTGKLVFGADFYRIQNASAPLYIQFYDSEDNQVFQIYYQNGDGRRTLYYQVGTNAAVGGAGYSEYRVYRGWGIKDMVFDLDAGTVSYTVDNVHWDGSHPANRRKVSQSAINFGIGKNIAKVRFTSSAGASRTNYDMFIDNMYLYTLVSGTATTGDLTFIGSKDYEDGYLGSTSGDYVIKPNGKLHLQFKNYGSGAYNWNNWMALFNNSDKSTNLAYVRADAWELVSSSNTGITTSGNYWNDFQTDMYGSTIAIDITRTDGDVNMVATITTAASKKLTFTFNKTIGTASEDIVFRLSEDASCLVLDNTKTALVAPPTFAQTSITKTVTNTGNPIITVTKNTGDSPTSESAMYYTTDGSTPTALSSVYSDPVTVTGGNTIKAVTVVTAADGTTTLTSNAASLTTTAYIAGQTYDLSAATETYITNTEGFAGKKTGIDYGVGSTARYSKGDGKAALTIMGGLTTNYSGQSETYWYWMLGQGIWQSGGTRSVTLSNTVEGEVALFTQYDCRNDGTSWSINETKDYYESDCSFTINKSNNTTKDGNHVYMLKKVQSFVPAGTTVAPTISAVNYGTYSSDYALDFEHATGIQAYYSKATSDGKIIMTKVNSAVAAGEGLFIEKIDGDISIPVVASGATLTGNKLKAGGVEAPANSYVFANQGGVLGFYKLTSATNIPKGKAYMEAGTYGARLTIMFDDETTGISELKQAEQMNLNETVYNLRGQRMDKPGKGLFIVNGHKVVVK